MHDLNSFAYSFCDVGNIKISIQAKGTVRQKILDLESKYWIELTKEKGGNLLKRFILLRGRYE